MRLASACPDSSEVGDRKHIRPPTSHHSGCSRAALALQSVDESMVKTSRSVKVKG